MAAVLVGGPASAQDGQLTLLNPTNSIDFGQRGIGVPGTARAATLGNAGAVALSISSVALAGLDPADFVVLADGCTMATLAPDETCSVTLDFAPATAGGKSARLRLVDSAPGSPHEVPRSGFGFDPTVPSRQVGPIDVRYGFPIWYEDTSGERATLCYDANGLCTSPLPDPGQPPSVTDALINFPEEAFWSYAAARIPRLGRNTRTRLILSKEAAFLPGPPAVGRQIAFDRLRVRIDGLVPGAAYTITHPFGVLNLTAASDGSISHTSDIGCGGPPCDFGLVLSGPLSVHLRWDPAVPPAAPAGYLGDPALPHRIVGSPLGTNVFRVSGPGIGTIETNLFTVEGKIF